MTEHSFVCLTVLVNIDERVSLKCLRKHDKVSISAGLLSRECNYSLILEQYLLNTPLAFDDLVEWRVSELLKRHFCLLHLLQDLPVFGLGSPATHGEDWARLAKLGKDQVTVPIEALELLAQSTPQSKTLDPNLHHEDFITCSHQLRKICHGTNVLFEKAFGRCSDALICSALVVARTLTRRDRDDSTRVLQFLLDFSAHKFHIA